MKRNAAYPKLPAPLYALTVVTLAVFFTGLVAWRVPVDGYRAVAEIGRRAQTPADQPTAPGVTAAHIVERLDLPALNQSLADAIRYADARLANEQPDLQMEVSDERIRSTHSRLSIDVREVPECDQAICISYVGPDPAWSLALVEHLTRDYLLASSATPDGRTSTARALRDAQWRLDQTRHYERKARYGVEDMMESCFERLAGSSWRQGSDGLAAGPDAGSGAETDAKLTLSVNPHWQELQGQLAAMAEQLRPLVEHLTPQHPHILDLQQRMAVVEQELAATPQFLSPDQVDGGAPTVGAATTQASHMAEVVESYADDYRALRKAYEEAIGDREQAERRLAGLLTRPGSAADALAPESRWVIMPPTLAGRVGGRSSLGRVSLIGLVALACGALVAWLLAALKGLQRVSSVSELEQLLALPVVAQLSIDPAPPSVARSVYRGRVLRGIVWGAEVTLVLMLIVFVTGVLEGSQASRLLWDDPLAAIPDTIADALQKWL